MGRWGGGRGRDWEGGRWRDEKGGDGEMRRRGDEEEEKRRGGREMRRKKRDEVCFVRGMYAMPLSVMLAEKNWSEEKMLI